MNKPNTDSQLKTVGWDNIDWQKVDRYIFKLQKRIYAASRRGEIKRVRKLQKEIGYSQPGKRMRTLFGYFYTVPLVAVQMTM